MYTNGTIRVLVVGDGDAVTRGISSTLGGSAEVEVVGEAGSGDEAQAAVELLYPDVVLVLMESLTEGTDGVDTAHAITKTRPWVRVVIVTRSVVRYLVPAVKVGAAGILSPDTGREELLLAIRRIHQWAPYSFSMQ